jgi:Cellulose binding domain
VGRHRNIDGATEADTEAPTGAENEPETEPENQPENDATEVMPAVPGARPHRRGTFTASPLLLAAGAVALLLVLVVGGWALMGSRAGDDPLVYPWSSGSPGPIDVSVSFEPTETASAEANPSATASGSQSPAVSASSSVSPSPAGSPSLVAPKGNGVTAVIFQASKYSDGYTIHFTLTNQGASAVAGWSMELWFTDRFDLKDYWNAQNPVKEPKHLVLTSVRGLASGESVDVGIRAERVGSNLGTPMSCTVDGLSFPCVPKWTS